MTRIWLLLLLSLTTTITTITTAQKIPHFLFSGQSNMEGVVEDNLNEIMATLFSSDSDKNRLIDRLQHGIDSNPPTPHNVYSHMADELMRFKDEGILHASTFRNAIPNVDCSFYQMYESIDYRHGRNQFANENAVNVPLSPTSNCGMPFGPELMFGNVMRNEYYDDTTQLSIVKVASGGSTLNRFWSRQNGYGWGELAKQVQNVNTGEWKAFVWFQGESDAFDYENYSNYENEVTTFVANVREEIYLADSTTLFASPDDIPVIIVGMGCWIVEDVPDGIQIALAQAAFVSQDGNARLVQTDDLSCHYHYDVASQLIIGYRIAQAMQSMLGKVEQVQQQEWSYQEPPWWNRIVDEYGPREAKQCRLREFPPADGSLCPRSSRSCFWGTQQCGNGTVYPKRKCQCNGRNAFRGVWNCDDAYCPASLG